MSAPPASAPASAHLARSRVRVIFGALMLVLLLAALDQTIVATALPTMSATWAASAICPG